MSTATLDAAQTRFQDYLLDTSHNLDDLIADGGRASRAARLGIYANAYRARMVEAATADFTQLKNWLGDEAFEQLIHTYLQQHPSRHYTLRWFGEDLCDFLRTTEPYASHPELHEMAEFEWALCGAFDAADAVPMRLEDFAGIAPETWVAMQPQFHPSLHCIDLHGNLPEVWEALNEERDPPPVQFGAAPAHWLLWRQDLRLMFRPMGADEYACLQWFIAGDDIAAVCQRLADSLPAEQIPAHIAGLLGRWVSDNLLVTDRGQQHDTAP